MEICTVEGCEKELRNQAAVRGHMRWHKTKQEIESSANPSVSSARTRSDSASETLKDKIERLRKGRKPIGSPEKKWNCPENDGYHYRVFNDDWITRPGNIQNALAAGYEFVESDEEKQKPKIIGTNDNGTPIKGYLMRIPQEIFDEDQKEKQKVVDKIDHQIKTGSFQQGANDGRYIPPTGIKIMSDNRAPE